MQVRDAREGERVLERVHHLLKDRFGFYFSTVQVEQRCLDCETGEALEIDIFQAGARA